MGSYDYKIIRVKYEKDYYNGVVDAINELESLVKKKCEFTSWKPTGGINIINTTDRYNIMSQALVMKREYNSFVETDDDEFDDEV